MSMQSEERDWLDERMAVTSYLPDDGFTAKVVSQLPQSKPDAVSVLRWRILVACSVLAAGLLVYLALPVLKNAQHALSGHSALDVMSQVVDWAQHPVVMFTVAGCLVLSGFASIPLLRRWV